MATWAIEHGGRDWLYDDRRLLFDEAVLQKSMVGLVGDGMEPTPGEIERLRMGRHHTAWLAALVVARWRTGMSREKAAEVDTATFDLMAIRPVPQHWVIGGDGKAAAPPDEPEPAVADAAATLEGGDPGPVDELPEKDAAARAAGSST